MQPDYAGKEVSLVTAKEAIMEALRSVGKTQADAAHAIGLTPKQLSERLVRGTLRADQFLEILDAIGIDVTFTAKCGGKPIDVMIRGAGRRVKQMVDRTIYDTADSNAIANNFYADGIHEYIDGHALELYLTRDGRYFFAEYSNIEGVKDRISPINAEAAADFIEKHGTELHRKPNVE